MELDDISFQIGLRLDYKAILKSRQVNSNWRKLYYGKYFWMIKCHLDLGISESDWEEISSQIKSGQEIYLYFSGLNNIPIYGAEKYGSVYKLARNLARSSTPDYDLLEFFCQLSGDYRILEPLGRQNNREIINRLSRWYTDTIKFRLHIAVGACAGGHLLLTKEMLEGIINFVPIDRLLYQAVLGQNIEIIKYLPDHLIKYYSVIPFYSVCATENDNIIDHFLSRGLGNYSDGLIAAAAKGNKKLIYRLLDLGAAINDMSVFAAAQAGHWDTAVELANQGRISPNKILRGAAAGGHQIIVENLIAGGADDLDGALVSATKYNHVSLVHWLVDQGARVTDWTIDEAIVSENLEIFQYLVIKTNKPIDKINYNHLVRCRNSSIFREIMKYMPRECYYPIITEAVKRGRINIVKKLIDSIPGKEYSQLLITGAMYSQFNIVIELASRGVDWLPAKDYLNSHCIDYLSRRFF